MIATFVPVSGSGFEKAADAGEGARGCELQRKARRPAGARARKTKRFSEGFFAFLRRNLWYNWKMLTDRYVYLTDKNGICKEKSDEISAIKFNELKQMWEVRFRNNESVYFYRPENVRIVKNCLTEKESGGVYDYLLKTAAFSEIENSNGDNLLVKTLEKNRTVDSESALALYLNPGKMKAKKRRIANFIFPFGCNNSQYKAVTTALESRITVIQGPPGTGKTQTILNVIANLLTDGKTVLIVSNNNAATENVFEKLASPKCGLSFLCARLGKKENVDFFLENQSEPPLNSLSDWMGFSENFDSAGSIGKAAAELKRYFDSLEKIMALKGELAALSTEEQYYETHHSGELYSAKIFGKRNSSFVMSSVQKIQMRLNRRGRLSFWFRRRLKREYEIKTERGERIDDSRLLITVKMLFYQTRRNEITKEIAEAKDFCGNFQPQPVYDRSMKYLKYKIARKYRSPDFQAKRYTDSRKIFSDMRAFTNRYPIVLSTTFSSKNCAPDGFLYDYVIMDEASQVDLVTGALALSCAKNAVIVGDRMQLPNVIEEKNKEPLRELLNRYSLPKGYSFLNSFLVSVETVLPGVPRILLREHYRCHPRIINFCNQRFYGGKLIVMTEDCGEPDVLSVVKTVPGDFCRFFYNQRQIDVIKKEILPKLDECAKGDLGIIAPYNRQVEEIRAQIPEAETATVHKFQGREKETIIISTTDNVVGEFSDNANLLNVAVSRAKKRLALVVSGNEQPHGSNIAALIDYIRYRNFEVKESAVCSVFDFLYSQYTKERFRSLRASKKISRYETENRMYGLLTDLFSRERYAHFGVVFEMPLKDVIGRSVIDSLPEHLRSYAANDAAHVDFTVYDTVTKAVLFGIEVDGYHYHKKGTAQAERDEKKNEIFRLINLPLLRFGTRGSGEEETLIEMLEKFCC